MSGKIVSINISDRKGVRKKRVSEAVINENYGVEGDAHASAEWHRQVSLLALESVKKMQALGLKVGPGDFAENVTTEGVDLVRGRRRELTLQRFGGMCVRLFPWLLLHLPAVGLVAAGVLRGWRPVPRDRVPAPVAGPPVAVLAGVFYVGWLIQAVALQRLFDYVHAPGVLLAILTCGVVAGSRRGGRPAARVGWIAFAAVALLVSPAVRWSRLTCWADCLRHGRSAEIRDRARSGVIVHMLAEWTGRARPRWRPAQRQRCPPGPPGS